MTPDPVPDKLTDGQKVLLRWLEQQALPWSPGTIDPVRHLGYQNGVHLDRDLAALARIGRVRKTAPNTWDLVDER